ncbi:YqcC family protein [Marinomonas balearica]|uniref:Uncharacterized protein YqcC (DUF446 family) n=1 Tax=Marinomonas balearica TaxID=491947 RepID=A0A4R6MC25_9GAMM|nr:YqcC family protein [Marinomonas balearica]TDO99073.1 uncharacterized protein YqcC (DUF446 family) [Marinomonas balearica]
MTLDIKRYHDLADSLLDLEILMREAGVWECEKPEEEAFKSRVPFAVDCMTFNQWLKFIMIPKFKEMIELGSPLPRTSSIAEYASEAGLNLSPENERKILHCIRSIDQILSQ